MTEKIPWSIVNIVAVGNVGRAIPLNSIAMNFEDSEYSPEEFPGIVLKISRPKCSFLVFGSGKLVCTGCRSQEEIDMAFRRLSEILEEAIK